MQTAEGGLNETHSILQRMRDLAVQAGNDSNNADSRTAIQTEVGQLQKELTRIASSTNFNGTSLLSNDGSLKFQVGANAGSDSQIVVDLSGANVSAIADRLATSNGGASFALADSAFDGTTSDGGGTFTAVKDGVTTTVTTSEITASSVDDYAKQLNANKDFSSSFTASVNTNAQGVATGITVTAKNGGEMDATSGSTVATGATVDNTAIGLKFDTAANAQKAIAAIDAEIKNVSTARSNLGAIQNRFDHAINVTNVAKENLTAAGSRITDVDMAEEMVKYTRDNILSQAGTSMLAQANQSTQGVLSLLR